MRARELGAPSRPPETTIRSSSTSRRLHVDHPRAPRSRDANRVRGASEKSLAKTGLPARLVLRRRAVGVEAQNLSAVRRQRRRAPCSRPRRTRHTAGHPARCRATPRAAPQPGSDRGAPRARRAGPRPRGSGPGGTARRLRGPARYRPRRRSACASNCASSASASSPPSDCARHHALRRSRSPAAGSSAPSRTMRTRPSRSATKTRPSGAMAQCGRRRRARPRATSSRSSAPSAVVSSLRGRRRRRRRRRDARRRAGDGDAQGGRPAALDDRRAVGHERGELNGVGAGRHRGHPAAARRPSRPPGRCRPRRRARRECRRRRRHSESVASSLAPVAA